MHQVPMSMAGLCARVETSQLEMVHLRLLGYPGVRSLINGASLQVLVANQSMAKSSRMKHFL